MLRLLAIASMFLGTQCSSTIKNMTAEDYPAETHEVITKDGYILELHRIPYGRNADCALFKKAVFLMHGFLTDSTSFTYLGPQYAIAYNLAEAGYDVWMGNARGTRFSRHVSLNPDKNKRQFYNFSFEEIALFDLTAMIDYVLATTNQDNLHYVGHSQGGTVFFILNSMNSTYQSKFVSAHLLAGIGYQSEFPCTKLKLLSHNTDPLYTKAVGAGIVDLYHPEYNNTAIEVIDAAMETITNTIFNLPIELFSGGSVKQAAHYGQNIRDERFRRWNYGYRNLREYGSRLPPSYNLSSIYINVTLHYSFNDILLSETDALAMASAMPNATARKVDDDSFITSDYIVNKNVKELVTDFIIESYKYS